MAIPSELAVLAVFIIGTPLLLATLVVDGMIVRSVCRKEGKQFPSLWFLRQYWHWRIFSLGWFREAAEAGYLSARLVLMAAWIALILTFIVANAMGVIVYRHP